MNLCYIEKFCGFQETFSYVPHFESDQALAAFGRKGQLGGRLRTGIPSPHKNTLLETYRVCKGIGKEDHNKLLMKRAENGLQEILADAH